MDPHKRSATIEVMTADETVAGGGRFGTDRDGCAAMLRYGKRWPDRVWAIEGCAGIGKHIAIRLVADGEEVVDVPPKLSARARVFATGQGESAPVLGISLFHALDDVGPASLNGLLMPVKRNRFIQLSGGTKKVNRTLEAKARALAGIKGYVTNLDGVITEFVIGAYHRLFQIEKSFRMSKHDLQARPIYHHKRDSIKSHLTIVFAALAVSRWIEQATGWSIKKFVRTTRRYRTIEIQAGNRQSQPPTPYPTTSATRSGNSTAETAAH
jgi:hypothetical protein